MKVVYERCAGCDVHKKMVTVHAVVPEGSETRAYATTTTELLALTEWLSAQKVTHVAMESTGVYWKPLYNLLEATDITVFVVNAAHMKAVPGRKTDVQDAAWICDLMRHGLLKASFIPPRPQRELRELVRYRISLIRERADEANRIQKVLEGGNIKLGSVITDILGKSGRAILRALLAGERDPGRLADLALGRLREKLPALREALAGRLTDHHVFLLGRLLGHLEYLEGEIEAFSRRIDKCLRPLLTADQMRRLDRVPGVNRQTVENVVAEIGVDMSRFPSSAHLASWAGMCPGNDQSAGKRRSGKTRKGSKWLRSALTEAAHAAARTKGSYLSAHYARIRGRRGSKKAAVAVGHSILVIAYHLLKRKVPYEELGEDYYVRNRRCSSEAHTKRLVRQLERLGHKVVLEPLVQSA